MLTVKWRDGSVSWISPQTILITGGGEDRVRRVLDRPATDTDPIVEDGVHGEEEVKLRPGDQRHARAALRQLPGAVILLDDEDG